MKWRWYAAALIVLAVMSILVITADVAPPKSITKTNIRVLRRAVASYVQTHGALPATIPDVRNCVPEYVGRDDLLRDGWGDPLVLSSSEDGVISIRSKRGMEGKWRLEKVNGQWRDPGPRLGGEGREAWVEEPWIHDP